MLILTSQNYKYNQKKYEQNTKKITRRSYKN